MSIPYRPLGLITVAVEKMDLEVTHAYEDLVFISHNAFLLRMDETPEVVHMYFNEESEPELRPEMTKQFGNFAQTQGLCVLTSGTYKMTQRPDEQIDIHFSETPAEG